LLNKQKKVWGRNLWCWVIKS